MPDATQRKKRHNVKNGFQAPSMSLRVFAWDKTDQPQPKANSLKLGIGDSENGAFSNGNPAFFFLPYGLFHDLAKYNSIFLLKNPKSSHVVRCHFVANLSFKKESKLQPNNIRGETSWRMTTRKTTGTTQTRATWIHVISITSARTPIPAWAAIWESTLQVDPAGGDHDGNPTDHRDPWILHQQLCNEYQQVCDLQGLRKRQSFNIKALICMTR
jgi:hypothetical protein